MREVKRHEGIIKGTMKPHEKRVTATSVNRGKDIHTTAGSNKTAIRRHIRQNMKNFWRSTDSNGHGLVQMP